MSREEPSATTEPTRVTTVRLPAHLADMLELVARVDGVPLAEAIRCAAYAHIEARRADEAFMARLHARIESDARILRVLTEDPS